MDIVNLMISKGADNWGYGDYSCACDEGHMEIGKFNDCLKVQMSWNWGLKGACDGGHMDIVNLMISKGANVWDLGLRGACYGGHVENH